MALAITSTRRSLPRLVYHQSRRQIFSWLWRKASNIPPPDPVPILSQDNLFHPLTKSPFKDLKARGEAVKNLTSCPVCLADHQHEHAHTKAQTKRVEFECPDCGWPTHCSEEHWREDIEHQKFCIRLREANEDEHDLRSGRRMLEFEYPGPQDQEEAISFATWDTFWYTRGFASMDTERSRRLCSKVLTFPLSIGSTVHQFSPLMLRNQRVTPEGSRSLAALRTTLHVEPGAPETEEAAVGKPQIRIFMPGARYESTLPPHVWEQLALLFPSAHLHLFFIGPQIALPRPLETASEKKSPASSTLSSAPPTSDAAGPEHEDGSAFVSDRSTDGTSEEKALKRRDKPDYVPNVYEPPTPPPIPREKYTRNSLQRYGYESYTTPYTSQLTITGIRAPYSEVHEQFESTLDPYSDLYFFFHPGFGFPSLKSVSEETGERMLGISSPTEWGGVIPKILASKCTMFCTSFSPADLERDVKSLATDDEVKGNFDWVITPGPNTFGSEKWEVADFDPRVMIKPNWGIWAIRGKSREIQERGLWEDLLRIAGRR